MSEWVPGVKAGVTTDSGREDLEWDHDSDQWGFMTVTGLVAGLVVLRADLNWGLKTNPWGISILQLQAASSD